MSKILRVPLVSWCTVIVGALLVIYVSLIATVMTYASLTIEFSQSVKSDESAVAELETQYLRIVDNLTSIDYTAQGYALPVATVFVAASRQTALR